jgi:hypothetical protein
MELKIGSRTYRLTATINEKQERDHYLNTIEALPQIHPIDLELLKLVEMDQCKQLRERKNS